MSFKLALVAVVHRTSAADDGKPSLVLLQGANAWLQRLAAGIQDDLFLIGVGFEDAPAFQAMLRPYGLANATIDVVPPEAEEDGDLDSDDWRESVASLVEGWISRNHPSAIPLVNWAGFCGKQAYSVGDWWWVGLEPAGSPAVGLTNFLRGSVPDAFSAQTPTWLGVIAVAFDLDLESEGAPAYEAAMTTVALTRWLIGFDAATENNFFEFDAADMVDDAEIDGLRLGIEAGRYHESDLSDEFDDPEIEQRHLDAACLLACLRDRNPGIRAGLADVFGGDASLFWTLYRSIWQKWPRLFEQLPPSFKWTAGRLQTMQSCPRRRSALATNRPTRWATRGTPQISSYAAIASVGSVARYFSSGVSRSRLECGR